MAMGKHRHPGPLYTISDFSTAETTYSSHTGFLSLTYTDISHGRSRPHLCMINPEISTPQASPPLSRSDTHARENTPLCETHHIQQGNQLATKLSFNDSVDLRNLRTESS